MGVLIYAYVVRFLAITMKPLQAGAAKIPVSFDEAGALSGRSRAQTYIKIHLPLLRTAMGTGLIIICIDLFKELPMTLVLRPFNFDTLATLSYELAQQDRLPEAALPALILITVCIGASIILTTISSNQKETVRDVP